LDKIEKSELFAQNLHCRHTKNILYLPCQSSKNILQGHKETNLGQHRQDKPALSSGQALAKSDNWMQVNELDVIVDSRVATCEDETLSEKSSRNIYHFSREPGGNFVRQNDSNERYLLLKANKYAQFKIL
jgi:hypothetical protein